ncbi:MAG TPA: putative Ig domain-containing protein [Acidimicrobiia bacterium]
MRGTERARPATHLLRLIMILVLVFGHVLLSAKTVAASLERLRDTFGSISYDNDDGTLPWSGSWAEIGESTDPLTGNWRVTTDAGFPGYSVEKTGQAGNGIVRSADLDGFTSATLHFAYRREALVEPKSIAVQASSSGPGGPWTTVYTIPGATPSVTDLDYLMASVDITEHISSATSIRFIHVESAGAFGARMAVFIDDVEISVEQTNRAPVLAPIGGVSGDEGTEIGLVASATDPDGDGLVFSLAGEVPVGASITGDGVFSWVPDESQGPGSYLFDLVVSDTGSPVLTATETVTVTVAEVNEAPMLVSPEDRLDEEGASVSLQLEATDPDLPANWLSWLASGLPAGLVLGSDGVISGVLDDSAAAGSPYLVTVDVLDEEGLSDQVSFSWTVTGINNGGGTTETNETTAPSPAPGPEHDDDQTMPAEPGRPAPVVAAAPIPLVDDAPRAEVETKVVVGPSNQGFTATLTRLLGAAGLLVPTAPQPEGAEDPPLLGAMSLFIKAFFHTIMAMDIPTLLLGFTAITLVGLRGVSRYPVLLNRRAQHFWAVVMLGRERRLAVHEAPDFASKVIYKLGPATQSLRGAGLEEWAGETRWVGVSTPAGEGWVDGSKVTEQVDAKSFLHDVRPQEVLEDFLGRLRSNRDVSDLVSERGLALVLADMIQVLDRKVLGRLVSDPSDTGTLDVGWNPRDFHLAVVSPLLDAYANTPVISPHVAHAETSLLPAAMRNFRYLALGGGTRPWLVFFEYSGGKPKVVGLTIDE